MAWPSSFWPSSYWPSGFFSLSGGEGAEVSVSDSPYLFSINGIERKASVQTFQIHMVLNGIDTGVATILLDDGSPEVRFELDDEVELRIDGVKRWAGYVSNVDEDGEGGPNTGRYLQRLSLVGYAEILQRRHLTVSQSLGSPGSPGAALDDFLTSMVAQDWGTDGITIHPSQSTASVLKDVIFEDALSTEILNRVATDAGLVWRVDEFKRLRVWAKGDVPAPFDIDADTDDPALYFGDIRTTKARYQGYANRVIVKGQQQTILDYGENVTHDGSQTSFTTTVPMLGTRQAAIGSTGPLTSLGIADGDTLWEGLGPEGSTSVWRYSINAETKIGTFRRPGGALPSGTITRLVFDAEVKPRGEANDLTEQASYPVRDVIINAPVTTDADAQDLSETILPFLVAAKDIKAKYSTREQAFLTPGMDQEIIATDRALGASPRHLLTKVTLRTEVGSKLLVQDVDTTTGDLPRGDWRDIVAQFSAGVSPSNISNGNATGNGGNNNSTTVTNPDGDANEGGSGSSLTIPPDDTDVLINKNGSLGTIRHNDQHHFQGRHGRVTGSPPVVDPMFQVRLTTLADAPEDSPLVVTTPNNTGTVAVGNLDEDTAELLFGLEVDQNDYMIRQSPFGYISLETNGGHGGEGFIGVELVMGETIGQAATFGQKFGYGLFGDGIFEVYEVGALGTGAVHGMGVWVERNNAGNGAAGHLRLEQRDDSKAVLWSEAGLLRIGADPPTEDDSVSHTGGTIVGTQSSLKATKHLLGRMTDRDASLALFRRTPVQRFTYKSDGYNGTEFVGITTDDSPEFGMDQGRSFNPVSAFGHTVLAIQALDAKLTPWYVRVWRWLSTRS